jgi:Type IV pilin-like G and H, putative
MRLFTSLFSPLLFPYAVLIIVFTFLRSQAYYYRENGKFAQDFDALELGIFRRSWAKQGETEGYHYRMYNLDRGVILISQPKVPGLKSVIAYDVVGSPQERMAVDSRNQPEIYMVICQSDSPQQFRAGESIPQDFRFIGTKAICPSGYTSLEDSRTFFLTQLQLTLSHHERSLMATATSLPIFE